MLYLLLITAALLFLPHKRSIPILVRSGYSIHDYARVLSDTSYIPYIDAVLLKITPKQKGVYSSGNNMLELIQNIIKRRQVLYRIHIRSGSTADQAKDLLSKTTGLQGPVPHIAEGSLLADTYVYNYFTSRARLVKYASTLLDQTLYRLWLRHQVQTKLSNPDQVIILASIVVKECNPPEYHKVAQVFLNRLERGMKLESNAPIAYLTGKDRVLFKDLTIESPYNTYLHKGLPPGPIGMVSKAAIKAVLTGDTSASKYIFFVKRLGSGDHVFTVTFKEHVKVQQDQAAQRRQLEKLN